MVAISKKNVMIYKCILMESYPKSEIFKYILGRIAGVRKKFDRDVIIRNNGIKINCGRIFENCSIACSYFEKYMNKELKMDEGVFIDVGAHVGKHSIYVAKKLGNRGKVLSIEANNETANLIKENIKLNNLDNVEVFEIICLDKKKEITFFKDDFHTATNSIYKKDGKYGIKKNADSLDNLFPNIKNVKIIKIDVEGAEESVIDGAKKIIKNNKPKIIFEGNNQVNSIKNKLLKYNYRIRYLSEDNYIAEVV